jgi:oligopeptidase A
MTATNPLLEATALPAFSKIRPEHVEPAIDRLLDEARRALDELLAEPEKATWATLIEPLTLIDNRLERAWSPVSHLNSVMNSEELRAAYDRCMVKLTSYSTERGQNARLFRAYQAIYDTGEDLSDEQRRVLENALRDFRLSGVDLPDDRKARYRAISEELSTLASDFQNKVLDATHAWSKHVTDAAALRGLPASALDLARQTAEQRGLEGFVLTLDFPSYLPVMTYAEDAALREEVYPPSTPAPATRGRRPASSTTRGPWNGSSPCATSRRSCSASPITPSARLRPRWPVRRTKS